MYKTPKWYLRGKYKMSDTKLLLPKDIRVKGSIVINPIIKDIFDKVKESTSFLVSFLEKTAAKELVNK
jgi:hypothetical protein